MAGFFMITLGNGLVAWAEVLIPSGVAAIICSLMPMAVILINLTANRDEKPTRANCVRCLGWFGGNSNDLRRAYPGVFKTGISDRNLHDLCSRNKLGRRKRLVKKEKHGRQPVSECFSSNVLRWTLAYPLFVAVRRLSQIYRGQAKLPSHLPTWSFLVLSLPMPAIPTRCANCR